MRKILMLLLSILLALGSVNPIYAKESENYKIEVNCTQNIVTVYEKNDGGLYEAKTAFVCSVGNDTPSGTFTTTDKYEWRQLVGNVYGQYATRIVGSILFHSVPYYTSEKDSLEYEEYNKLGTTASLGCIRLAVEDAKWIFENCSYGTQVKIYRSDEAEPLEKPKPIRIDVTDPIKRNWDPTDSDENNPWNSVESVEPKAEDKTKDIRVFVDNREIMTETYTCDDGSVYLTPKNIAYILSSKGNSVTIYKSDKIVFARKVQIHKTDAEEQNIAHIKKGFIAAVNR